MKRLLIFLIAASQAVVAAGPSGEVASQARDSAAAFVATQDFVVARIGRDCLAELGRPETPAEYREKWRKANAKYYDASSKYMEARFDEIEDPIEKARVQSGYYNSVNGTGDAAADRILRQGSKKDVCKATIELVDAGNMNIETVVETINRPIKDSLDELVKWARSH